MSTRASQRHMLYSRAAYNAENKAAFHRTCRTLLRGLAAKLNECDCYGVHDPIRSNQGGPAVSGEITLHYDKLYVQVSQPAVGTMETGVMFRLCRSRKDYAGLQNNFAPLSMLLPDNVEALVDLILSKWAVHRVPA